MTFKALNPTTGEIIEEYPEHTLEQVDRMIEAAQGAFLGWRKTGFDERARLMHRAAQVLRDKARDYACLITEEMGKPITQSRAEIEKCARNCDYYADHAESFLADQEIETEARRSFVTFQPLGVVLAIMPWNFPFWQTFRFAAPALMAGNAAVLKHASNVPGCALAIESVFREAGFPRALFRSLLIHSDAVEKVIEDPRVSAVTLTGSVPAGRAVAARAGACLKKTVLELGGSDAYVILEDADLDAAAEICAKSRLINSGQSCIAAKRFIVPRSVREDFETRLVDYMRAAKVGDPMDEATEVGPLARPDLRHTLDKQVRASLGKGARCLLGGEIEDDEGSFYPPTVLTDVTPGMPAYEEELFGPVAAVIPVADEAEALEAANDSVFGLGAAVFTTDVQKGERIAAEDLAAGACFVNALVQSDPRLPFGGIKDSGYGRELSSFGIREFTNIKTVYVK